MTTKRRKAAPAQSTRKSRSSAPRPRTQLAGDPAALKTLGLVAVAYSHVEREWFPTEEAYEAEAEVEARALQVVEELEKLGVTAKSYPSDQYFLTNLLVDRPDLVLNLVDTLRGNDALSTSVPAALELASIPYTGAGMVCVIRLTRTACGSIISPRRCATWHHNCASGSRRTHRWRT